MPHQSSVEASNGFSGVYAISHHLYRALVSLQQQNPELLNLRYQEIPWQDSQYKTAFIHQLHQGLSKAKNQDALRFKLQQYLKTLFTPEFFHTLEFNTLTTQLESLISSALSTRYSSPVSQMLNGTTFPDPGISILLLDVENLPLDYDTEQFLQTICHYPLQIKVAFANWRSMGKKDLEFHQRGYQLIHVPPGKDSADLKMATVGSSIFVHYPTAREVFVCSSDQALSHLCTSLQTHGLTVYQVTKQNYHIIVFNGKTGQTQQYSLMSHPEVPPLDEFLVQLQTLIDAEQKRTKAQWLKLSRVSALYKETYNITLSQVVSSHFPDCQARDIFVKNPNLFALHKPSEKSQTYVTLFNVSLSSLPTLSKPQANGTTLSSIDSLEDLEKALVEIVQDLLKNSSEPSVSISILGSHFNSKYGQSLTQLIKKFQPGSKFTKFLNLCPSFTVEKKDADWQIKLN